MAGAVQWSGDEASLLQLCHLFNLASSPDNAVQQQVMETLNKFAALPDFNLYLVTVFAKMQGQPEIVRQRAGLLLKTNISKAAVLQQQMADYIQAHTLEAVRDPSKVIRHTAGTVITTIVQKQGIATCVPTLDRLAQNLGEGNAEVMEGSFNALSKICEDGVVHLKQFWDTDKQHTLPFVAWCTERLLPRVFEYAKPNAPVQARQNAIECLNHFALNYLLTDDQYPAFRPFAPKYIETLGVLAQDPDVQVLRDVCKGFVCVIENGWACLNPQMAEVVLQYMLKASRHPEYMVRLEALEIWTPCTHTPAMLNLVRPLLPELVPILLANMVYSQADYMTMEQSQIDDDNAAQPDSAEDIRPRTHKEKGDEKDDDDGGVRGSGGAWGAEWTARKAAASSLDFLANAFRADILPFVLPLVQQKLEDPSWEVQESGVLALGAIAFGCMQNLEQFLPQVMQLLLRLCEAEKPLVRSISCWCASRFSQWICYEQNPQREQILQAVLKALLQRVLDKNKRVQEAACSAFATLEEQAHVQLVPYLDDIVSTLVRAFQYYQAKNLLILYDAVGTLANCVSCELNKPQYVQALLVPLAHRFDTVADNDRSIVALFECLGAMAQNIGVSMMPLVHKIVQRCVRLVQEGARAAQMWLQNPNEFEKPDREVTAASIDLLSGLVEGLMHKTDDILRQQNFICVVPEVLKDTALQVKQSAFALVGDCAKYCSIEFLGPFLPEILPAAAAALQANTSPTVSNNASWAIGEICVKVGADFMGPYVEGLLEALVGVVTRAEQPLLLQNVCITIGRLGLVCGPQLAKALPNFAPMWCEVMKSVRWDGEKVNAFQGMCSMIKANPQGCINCVPQLATAICSFVPPPPVLEPPFREILTAYKTLLGANWPTVYGQMGQHVQLKLHHLYGLTMQ